MELSQSAPKELQERVQKIDDEWRLRRILDCEAAAAFIVAHAQSRYGKLWLAAPRQADPAAPRQADQAGHAEQVDQAEPANQVSQAEQANQGVNKRINYVASACGYSPYAPRHAPSFAARISQKRPLNSLLILDDSATLKRFGTTTEIRNVLKKYHIFGLANRVQNLLLWWLDYELPLDLTRVILSPSTMLQRQCEGRRWVSMICEPHLQTGLVFGKRDAYTFLCHDLEHAERFFLNKTMYHSQISFFQKISSALQAGFFDFWLNSDPSFVHEFEYLMSDMNSHPVHMLKYLKAIILVATLRQDGKSQGQELSTKSSQDLQSYFDKLFLFFGMSDQTKSAALRLNVPEFEIPSDHHLIGEVFLSK